MPRGAWIVALGLCAIMPGTAGAQRLIAVTQALSATREAGAIYAHSVDLKYKTLLPGAERLLGTEFDALHLWPDGTAALAITGGPPLADTPSPRWWRGVRPSPFQLSGEVLPAPPALGTSTVLKIWDQPGGAHWLARVGARGAKTVVSFQPWNSATNVAAALEREVEGRYLTGAPIPGGTGAVLVVVERADGQFFAVVVTLAPGGLEMRERELSAPKNALDARPRAAVADTGTGYVLFGGYDLSANNARTASWLLAFPLEGASAPSELQLLGAPQEAPYALVYAAAGACWCITREPGRDVAYVTLARWGEKGLDKAQQYPLPGARGPLLLTANDAGDVLTAMGTRIERWPAGVRGDLARTFETPLGVVLWTSAGPVIAEAGRIDLLSADTLETRASVQCQSGQVAALAEVPAAAYPPDDEDGDGLDAATERALGTNPKDPDSDHDGLHDGIDPEPTRATTSLRVPPMLIFNGDAAGQELHDLLVRPGPNPDARWQVTYPAGELPWLRLYPATSYGVRPVYIGIDPQFHASPKPLQGVLRLTPLRTLQSKADAPPSEVLLAVRPPREGPARILWMLSENTPADLVTLRDRLSAPPLCFSHRATAGVAENDLAQYALVVLGTGAAARGEVPQHALVDYVSGGGAVLVVPEDAGASARDVSAWFAPLGFRIENTTALTPPLAPQGDSGPAMAFAQTKLALPRALTAQTEDLVVRGTNPAAGAVFLRQFGLGRVAAVADAKLIDPADTSTRAFTEAVFRWLARAGLDISDLDGDGLPDSLEDANGNQALDPGETDRLNPDTDGDGIPDGMEDRNHNGIVDDGETDPRNPDSDGDGILDGADPSPCPALGAPRILAASPATGPAEGGTLVTISGANFDNTAACYFGGRPAELRRVLGADRIEVAAPPFDADAGGAIDLRVETRGAAKAVLPKGYQYTPRSTLHFSFASAVAGWKHDKLYNGVLSLSLDKADTSDIGQIVLVIAASPADAFTFGAPRPGPVMPQAGRYIEQRAMGGGRLLIVLGPGLPKPFPTGDLLRIPWEYARDTPPGTTIHIGIGQDGPAGPLEAAALASSGGPLHLECAGYALDVDEKAKLRVPGK